MGWLKDARVVWRTVVVLLTPLLFLPLALPGAPSESKCAYVLVVMAVYWITECLPLAVTALLPLVMLPLLNIMASKEVSVLYFKDVIVLLTGGLMVAIAIEESNLHKRFALRLLLLLGVQPRKLLLGFMLATGLLSMWITNTATTAMMTPIARSLLARLFQAQKQHRRQARQLRQLEETAFSWPVGQGHKEGDIAALEKELELEAVREVTVVINGSEVTHGLTQANDDPHPHPLSNNNSNSDQQDGGQKSHSQTSARSNAQAKRGNNDSDNDNDNIDHSFDIDGDDDVDDDDDDDDGEVVIHIDQLDRKSADLVKALCLSVCYSANIGGVGTLTGTGPNIVFKNYVESLSQGRDHISYVSWMAFGTPVAAVNLAITWLWLQLAFFGLKNTLLCRRQTSPREDLALTRYLRRQHRRLGKMSFAEKAVLVHFVVLVGLWLTRAPGVFPGWSTAFPSSKYVSDSVPAVLVALSLFVIPREMPAIFCCKGKDNSQPYVSSASILQWSSLSRKFPWGVLLLLGGGFALAEATRVSGLSTLIADQLMVIRSLPTWVAGVVVVIVTSITTEITSNTVIATLLLPILATVAASMDVHPVYFMLPSTVAASFAFMLPVATPPNAIVFAHGDVKVTDMIRTGVALNIICITVVTVAINTFGTAYFGLGQIPDWALRLAVTTPSSVNSSTPSLMNMYEMTSAAQGLVTNITSVY